MVFSSVLFVFYFLPLFLVVYHILNEKYKNYFLLISSLVFYAWGAPRFIFLLLASLVINFYTVKSMFGGGKGKHLFLIASLVINVGLLAYFKYANFFVDNVNVLLSLFDIKNIQWVKVVLPIGISFFTFQSITYTLDVYRGVHRPLEKLTDYLSYILMFPQLIAGPIVRFSAVADDLVDRKKNDTLDNKLYGIYRFVIGLSKKILIANIVGEQVDVLINKPFEQMDSFLVWVMTVGYSIQIYFDFSGYSDMAIGLGRIIGFKFPENFNNPYISQSITEFWRRWHITLGQWMRDYLYIPLGGNRVNSNFRLYFNLIFVFVLSGLWHGAAWSFIVWGAWHGFFLILDRLFLVKLLSRAGKVSRVFFTYIIVIVGWLFFRIESFSMSMPYLKKMFAFNFSNNFSVLDTEFIVSLFLGLFFSFFAVAKGGQRIQDIIYSSKHSIVGHIALFVLSMFLFVLCSVYIASSGFNPFIYFRF